MGKFANRLAKLEQATGMQRTVIAVVEEPGVDPLPDYLARHPENVHCNIIVVDTGIYRSSEVA